MLREQPFVLCRPEHGRMRIVARNRKAIAEGIAPNMVLADARAICPRLLHEDYDTLALESLLQKLAVWSLRFTPIVALDRPDGLLLDISGCAHL